MGLLAKIRLLSSKVKCRRNDDMYNVVRHNSYKFDEKEWSMLGSERSVCRIDRGIYIRVEKASFFIVGLLATFVFIPFTAPLQNGSRVRVICKDGGAPLSPACAQLDWVAANMAAVVSDIIAFRNAIPCVFRSFSGITWTCFLIDIILLSFVLSVGSYGVMEMRYCMNVCTMNCKSRCWMVWRFGAFLI